MLKNLFLILSFIFLIQTIYCQNGYELKQVQIIIRHGARAPFQLYPEDPTVWECKLHPFGSIGTNSSDTLKPKDRSYSRQYIPGRNVLKGNCAQGELTTQGRQMHVKLGGEVKQQYSSFLPKVYNESEIYIRSTDVPRTVESAASFLSGLYPESEGNPKNINIWMVEKDKDDMQAPQNCNLLNYLCNSVQLTKEWDDVLIGMVPTAEYLAPNLGIPVEQVPWWPGFRNTMECRSAHDIAQPDFMKPDIVEEIDEVAVWQLTQLYNDQQRARLLMGKFLGELKNNMEKVVESHQGEQIDPKFFLFSSHDTTVGPLLGALRAWQNVWPRFASHLHLELYEKSSQYYVRGLYNDNIIHFENCTEYCPWNQFTQIIKDSISNNDEWQAECDSISSVETNEYTDFLC